MSGPTRRQFLAALGASALSATAGCVSSDGATYEGTWSRPGFDDARTGFSPATGPTGPLTAAWRADVFDGYPTTSPVVADGVVYYLHTRGGRGNPHESVVSAFGAATGAERWRTIVSVADDDELAYHHDSLVVADRIYLRTLEALYALSLDGDRLWRHPIPTTAQPYPIAAPPVVSDGVAVTATYGERTPPIGVAAVDAETGTPRWRVGFNSRQIPWTLAAADGAVYVPFFKGDAGVVALDLQTGGREWSVSLPVAGPVTVAGDTLLVPLDGDPEAIAAVDRRTGAIRWRAPGVRHTEAGVAVAHDRVYYCADRMLLARRLDTGDLVWSFGPTPRVSLSWTPVVAGDVVYALAEHRAENSRPHYLYALDAASGRVRGSGRVSRSATVSGFAVVDGAGYVALGSGELLCLEACAVSALGRCVRNG
ncbi:serine/threonine protein kinase-like protein [Haloferax larsenii JCM 13917]|nr:PQQ-binding-like beta-propeller repeat protein [Haloferax larsenii]ELZ74960.1 serine/threonine protein kinase-like protein [Haloferax larsenii JCM 13917]